MASRRLIVLGSGVVVLGALAGLVLPAAAAAPPPVGYWTTIDDDGKTPKAVVLIEANGSELSGKIVHIMNPEKRSALCGKCEGAQKDKPVLGMKILWGLKQNGAEWSGGSILDPNNGKTYGCFIEPLEGGKKLKVRGFIGISLLGRTQEWRRAAGPTG